MKNTILTKVFLLLFIVVIPLAMIASLSIARANSQLEHEITIYFIKTHMRFLNS